jgi:hypothetical protein
VLDDPVLDVELVLVAVAMLVLALKVSSLERRFSSPKVLATEALKEEPKMNPVDAYLHQFERKESVAENKEKETEERPVEEPKPKTETTAIMPRGKPDEEKPFNIEEFVKNA